jgi:hypothetical protein
VEPRGWPGPVARQAEQASYEKGGAVTGTEHARGAPGAIRVMTVGLPEDLWELLERSSAQRPEIVLLQGPRKGVHERVDILLAVASGVDALILGAPAESPPPGICSHLWGQFPDLKILVVAHHGDASVLYWQGLRRRRLRRVSAGALLASVVGSR